MALELFKSLAQVGIFDVRMPYFGALLASTTVEVSRLSHPDFWVEIEAIAIVD